MKNLQRRCEDLVYDFQRIWDSIYDPSGNLFSLSTKHAERFAKEIRTETLIQFLQEVVELEQKFTKEPDDKYKPGYSLGKFAGANIIKNRLVKLLEGK